VASGASEKLSMQTNSGKIAEEDERKENNNVMD